MTSYPPNPYTQVTATDSEREKRYKKPPANFYWELMENQPEHKPGYNDPLIVDDTQGDFGGNPIIHPGSKSREDMPVPKSVLNSLLKFQAPPTYMS